jgi:hypothetical protein
MAHRNNYFFHQKTTYPSRVVVTRHVLFFVHVNVGHKTIAGREWWTRLEIENRNVDRVTGRRPVQ